MISLNVIKIEKYIYDCHKTDNVGWNSIDKVAPGT